MGYQTDFEGRFEVTPPLSENHRLYLNAFAETRRMKRNESSSFLPNDDLRLAVGLPAGPEGAYYVGGGGDRIHTGSSGWSQEHIIDYNEPPKGQPGLWCNWAPTEDGQCIEWNQAEKFYDYIEWIQYLINNFLEPWGYKLNGTVEWQGEEAKDIGKIIIKNNKVTIKEAKIVWKTVKK